MRAPECAQRRRIGALHARLGPDRQALDIRRLGIEKRRHVVPVVERVAFALAQFGQHHAAFAIDRGRIEPQFAGGFAHQHQRGVQQHRIGARQIELIHRAFECRGGIGIRAKRQACALQHLDHVAIGQVRATLERHVFDKMRQAPLIIALVQRSGIDHQPHHRGARRRAVRSHDRAHAIAQLAETEPGIGCDIAMRHRPVGLWRPCHQPRVGGRTARHQRGGERNTGNPEGQGR